MCANFVKKKEFLLAVDSDGCVMDTMTSKHTLCFGPALVDVWGLDAWRGEILGQWNEVNLYSKTRGINRFRGLLLALVEINKLYTPIGGIEYLRQWCDTTHALSDESLLSELEKCEDEKGRECLGKALGWSREVNERIDALPREQREPFVASRVALLRAHEVCDIAVVSSANRGAIADEWGSFGLMECVDEVMAQDVGSKAHCIGELLKRGYDREKMLMVGDAIGDMEAAESVGVYYFPIVPRRENESWKELCDVALQRLFAGTYGGGYQRSKIEEFLDSFEN